MNRKSAVQRLIICVLLSLGIILIYAPALHFNFVTYDDQVYVINNYNINRGLSWAALKWAFNAGYCSNWHPLTWLSHAVDCQCFGMKPGPMHVVNVVLHALDSILLFLLLRGMTGATWRSAFVAAFFAWHPMHVESVAWISERKDVLSALFFILTIWAWWRYTLARPSHPRPALLWYLVSLALFVLGLMAKPMLVTLPFVLFLLDFWPLQRWVNSAKTTTRFWPLLAEKIPFLLLSAASCAITLTAQARGGAMLSLAFVPLPLRFINALIAYAQYLDKLVWPRGLSIFYPYNPNVSIAVAVWPALLLVVISAICLVSRRQRPFLLTGWLWFLGMLVPVIGLVQVGGQAMADRYSYLPSIGLFVMVVWTVAEIAASRVAVRVVACALGIAALAGSLVSARAQALTWRDGGALFGRAIAVDPDNYVAHASYAAYLLLQQDWDQAQAECRESLRHNQNYAPPHQYLGFIALKQHHLDEALTQLRWALRLDPNRHDTHLELGEAYLAQGVPENAAEEYEAYLAFDATDPSAHNGLGNALAAQGKWDHARQEYAAAVQIAPKYSDARAGLALALSKTGRTAEAIDEYHTALRFDANSVQSMNNLAWILAANPDPKLRNGPEAVALAERACALTRFSQPTLIGTLAAAYAAASRFDDAVNAAQKAHDVALAQGSDADVARNLQLLDLYRAHQPYIENP